MGASPKLKLKGIQEMAILDFDLSQLKGKKIESARLYMCNASKNNKLRRIGISTVRVANFIEDHILPIKNNYANKIIPVIL